MAQSLLAEVCCSIVRLSVDWQVKVCHLLHEFNSSSLSSKIFDQDASLLHDVILRMSLIPFSTQTLPTEKKNLGNFGQDYSMITD